MSGTSLIGKTVLITGAGSGIGKACVQTFATAGAKVIAVDRDEIALAKLASGQVRTVVADLSDPERYFPDNLEVDILINNAGVQHVAPIEDFPMEQADFMLSLMLRTPFYLTKKALPHMYKSGWGRIIGISSIHGHVASPFKSIYVTAKHGMEGLHKAISLEGGAHGVTANTIAPSYVRTPLVEKQIANQAEVNGLSEEEVIDQIMLAPAAIKRLIEPEEVAALALYLCGPYSGSITGSSFGVDNGWVAR
jgi:3-hydroxybutyrate dehydrogenase